MRSQILLILMFLFKISILSAQTLLYVEDFNSIQNSAITAARDNSFKEASQKYNELLMYARTHQEIAYLIDTKLCGYIITNEAEKVENQFDVQSNICSVHELIYDSFINRSSLSDQEKIHGIINLHKTFGEISAKINQLEIAGEYFNRAFNDYELFVKLHKKYDPHLLNMLAYIHEVYYKLYIDAFHMRADAFMNLSPDDSELDNTFSICYYDYEKALENLIGKIRLRTSMQEYNTVNENVDKYIFQKDPVLLCENIINKWRTLINFTHNKYGYSYIESLNLDTPIHKYDISVFEPQHDDLIRSLFYIQYDDIQSLRKIFNMYLYNYDDEKAVIIVGEIIRICFELGKKLYANELTSQINYDKVSLVVKERIQYSLVDGYSKIYSYNEVVNVLNDYSKAINDNTEIEYFDIAMCYSNLKSLKSAYEKLNDYNKLNLTQKYINDRKTLFNFCDDEVLQIDLYIEEFLNLMKRRDTLNATNYLYKAIRLNDSIAKKTMWHNKLHLSKNWDPEIHVLQVILSEDIKIANSIFKKAFEHQKFWNYFSPLVYRAYSNFLYVHNKENELHENLAETYKLLLNEYLISSISLLKQERSVYWDHYKWLSNFLEEISWMSLKYSSLTDIAYDIALNQKNFTTKYENIIKNDVMNSNNIELISLYSHYKEAELSLSIDQNKLEKEFISLYSSLLGTRELNNNKCSDIKNFLLLNDIAIEFTICGTTSVAALLLKNEWEKPKIIELCSASNLNKLISQGPRLYQQNDDAYSYIWEKLEPYLDGVENIYFAPHGLIHQMNIEVLAGKDGIPMNKKYNVYRVSSTGNLVDKREDSKYSSATLFGGLNYDTDTTSLVAMSRNYAHISPSRERLLRDTVQTRAGWSYLPGTATEVKNVSAILHKNRVETKMFTDKIGTEESFKALSGNSPSIIHIATHGFYLEDKEARRVELFSSLEDRENPQISPLKRSGLMFSGGQHAWLGKDIPEGIDDGVLTAEEIAGMNLSGTDLLVLSACQTGLGEITSAGVEGLQKGFKIAGVNTIIMSLWEVSDVATETMMTTFYKNLTKGKSKRVAFDKAVEAVKKKYPSPEYWAAFIMLD